MKTGQADGRKRTDGRTFRSTPIEALPATATQYVGDVFPWDPSVRRSQLHNQEKELRAQWEVDHDGQQLLRRRDW